MSGSKRAYEGAYMTRLNEDEEEIKRLENDRAGVTEEEDTPVVEPDHVPTEAIAANPDENVWQKRYSDLRRYVDKELRPNFERQLDELRGEISKATSEQFIAPTSEADLEAFALNNPEWFALIETVADKRAQARAADLESRLASVEKEKNAATRERAKAQLEKYHPDLDELRADAAFHEWVVEQGGWVQQALYHNSDNWRDAKNAIDLYKAHKGIAANKPTDTKPKKDPSVTAIDTKSRREEPKLRDNNLRLSEINAMSPKEFERRYDEIVKAQREGRIIDDLSEGTR